jgi:hypothetical protein
MRPERALALLKFADLTRISRRLDRSISGDAQHALKKTDIGFLIVNDQDAGVKNIG